MVYQVNWGTCLNDVIKSTGAPAAWMMSSSQLRHLHEWSAIKSTEAAAWMICYQVNWGTCMNDLSSQLKHLPEWSAIKSTKAPVWKFCHQVNWGTCMNMLWSQLRDLHEWYAIKSTKALAWMIYGQWSIWSTCLNSLLFSQLNWQYMNRDQILSSIWEDHFGSICHDDEGKLLHSNDIKRHTTICQSWNWSDQNASKVCKDLH